jgi:hypothetical protein
MSNRPAASSGIRRPQAFNGNIPRADAASISEKDRVHEHQRHAASGFPRV